MYGVMSGGHRLRIPQGQAHRQRRSAYGMVQTRPLQRQCIHQPVMIGQQGVADLKITATLVSTSPLKNTLTHQDVTGRSVA